MSGSLDHSPSQIIRQMLVDLSLGTLPSEDDDWPIFATNEPDTPDSVITVYDTLGKLDGRTQVDGKLQIHHGFQVRIRDANTRNGYSKANAIAIALDESTYQETVTISDSIYLVHSVSRTTDVLPIGKETPTSKRNIFTINATATLRQTA